MSTINKKQVNKVQKLSQVIAIQERTITKLQKVLDRERNTEQSNTSQRKRNEVQSSSRGNSKKKSKTTLQQTLSQNKTEQIFLPAYTNHQTEKSPNNKQSFTDRFEDKSSISRHRDEASMYHDQSIMNNQKLTYNRQIAQQSTNMASPNLQQEYQFEIQVMKDKFELFRIECETQAKINRGREKDFTMKIKEHEDQNKMKDNQIQILKRQLEFEKSENKLVNAEFSKQKDTWQSMYQDFCQEMLYLKEDLSQYCNESELPPKPKRNSYIDDRGHQNIRQSSEKYRQYSD